MRPLSATGIVACLGLACILASPRHARAESPPERATVRSARGSQIVFHGWSKDSRLVAYTRQRLHDGREEVEQRMHRFVKAGEFGGFGRMVGGDVARYALERGYVAAPLPTRRVAPLSYEFQSGPRKLALEFDVGQAHGWRLSVDGVAQASHRFDRIYIGFDVEAFASPDGTQVVLVMALDTGWEVDAAVFAAPLLRTEGEPAGPRHTVR
jgi:hypothetical protein